MLQEDFISYLHRTHPTLAHTEKSDQPPANWSELISPQLLCPFEIRLPRAVLTQAQEFVAACFGLRERADYQSALSQESAQRGLKDPGNKSICMSYDFHLDSDEVLKLIEINTNAAFLALGYEMYRFRELPLPIADFSMEEMRKNIETEIKLQGKDLPSQFRVGIIDQEPEKQRLFAEFLLFQTNFKNWGWNCEIADYRQAMPFDFIYNRHTDFYFQQPEAEHLKKSFLNKEICFSPNPYEYFMLADKQRMIDWSNEKFWQKLQPESQTLREKILKNLPLAKDLSPEFESEIWAERKKFFFKPKRAYGAKQSYRGATVSNRNFLEILTQDFIAQEMIPPPERKFQTPDGEQTFKFDLRFYAYQDRVQMVVARLYQGQVTNLRTPYGGFAPVIFE